jgi:hypothetical protein
MPAPVSIDLVAEFNKYVSAIPGNEAKQHLVSIEVNPGAVAVALANAYAEDIRENMLAGKRPDGKGAMPKREKDGAPRGTGTRTVASIAVKWSQSRNTLAICADETEPDALRRILRGIPFRPPITSERIRSVLENTGSIAAVIHAGAATRRGYTWGSARKAQWEQWQRTTTLKGALKYGPIGPAPARAKGGIGGLLGG